MIIQDTMCYTQLMRLMSNPKFVESCNKIEFKKPGFDLYGVNGYVKTTITFDVHDFETFAKYYSERYNQYAEETNYHNKIMKRYYER